MAKHAQYVRCSIKNCQYWTQGNQCNANEILVTSDAMADTLPPTIDAPMADQVAATPVQNCVDSCCKTFAPKNSYDATLDGVFKL